MALYAIGDLHLALGCDKPMDIFEGWQGYLAKLEANWRGKIQPEDTVVLAGDTSWAMQLEHAREDFAFIESLPGKKLLLKGNHDYWWSTAAKMRAFFAANGFESMDILFNNAHLAQGAAICGTRSWMFEQGQAHDVKLVAREAGRLERSLAEAERLAPGAEKLVFLHYPPVATGCEAGEMVALMQRFGVGRCFYGHLHGSAMRYAMQGARAGIEYRLISADGLGFDPLRII